MNTIQNLKDRASRIHSGINFARQRIRKEATTHFNARLFEIVARAQAHFTSFLNTKVENFFTATLKSISAIQRNLSHCDFSFNPSQKTRPRQHNSIQDVRSQPIDITKIQRELVSLSFLRSGYVDYVIDSRRILDSLVDSLDVQIQIGSHSIIRNDWESSPPLVDSLLEELTRYKSLVLSLEKRYSFSAEEYFSSPQFAQSPVEREEGVGMCERIDEEDETSSNYTNLLKSYSMPPYSGHRDNYELSQTEVTVQL